MSKNTQQTLHFRILPSKQIKAFSAALHACAMLACWLNALPIFYRAALAAVILTLWRLNTRRWNKEAVYLNYNGNTGWEISHDGLDYAAVTILRSTVITNRVIFLHYAIDNRPHRSLLIAKDSLAINDFRRLIVKLKLSGYGK